jgi:hypothetical protein
MLINHTNSRAPPRRINRPLRGPNSPANFLTVVGSTAENDKTKSLTEGHFASLKKWQIESALTDGIRHRTDRTVDVQILGPHRLSPRSSSGDRGQTG